MNALGHYRLLGESLDDAVGEAFDKLAKMMGLGYPGGPAIEQLAQKGQKGQIRLPRPMVDRPGLDFSFSGLKTHCARLLGEEKKPLSEISKANLACAFQEAVFDTLLIKLQRAIEVSGMRQVVVAGGVSANRDLRTHLNKLHHEGVKIFYPPPGLCTDNGVMIAYTACLRLQNGAVADTWPHIRPRWPLADLDCADGLSLFA